MKNIQAFQKKVTFDRCYCQSSYSCLARVTAWMLQFVKNCKERGGRITSPVLSVEEITKAERLWWQVAQKSSFREEITDLRNGKGVSHRSKILTYHPFIDDQDVL